MLMLLVVSGDIHLNPGPQHNFSQLKICHVNVRSLKSKGCIDAIKTELCDRYDIITVSETWLKAIDHSSDLKLKGYQDCQRKDRSLCVLEL